MQRESVPLWHISFLLWICFSLIWAISFRRKDSAGSFSLYASVTSQVPVLLHSLLWRDSNSRLHHHRMPLEMFMSEHSKTWIINGWGNVRAVNKRLKSSQIFHIWRIEAYFHRNALWRLLKKILLLSCGPTGHCPHISGSISSRCATPELLLSATHWIKVWLVTHSSLVKNRKVKSYRL